VNILGRQGSVSGSSGKAENFTKSDGLFAGADMARPTTSEILVLRNLAWALIPIAQASGRLRRHWGRRKAGATAFPASAKGNSSTLYYKIVETGLPTPHLYQKGGRAGPVLDIEKSCPGSMRFLFHHFWLAIENADYPTLRTVYVMMSALQGPIQKHAVRCIELHDCSMTVNYLVALLEQLFAEGTWDSLTSMILLAQQAFCLCDDAAHHAIAGYAAEHVSDWKCTQWMPALLRKTLSAVVLLAIARCAPAGIDLETARTEASQQIALFAAETDRTWDYGQFLSDLENAGRDMQLPDLDDSVLTEKSRQTLERRVLGRWRTF
jgi:hypothetical protein